MEQQKFAIATLPVPTSPPKIFQIATVQTIPIVINKPENTLNVADYSDKTFIVFGEATKIYKEQMKSLGGKFNGKLGVRPGFPGGAAWIFVLKLKPQVFDFINKVNNRKIIAHEGVTHQDTQSPTDKMNLPTVVGPITTSKYQSVRWNVFKPVTGMTVTIKAGGNSTSGNVIQVESHRNIVDTAFININGNISKLVICNGYWQVWAFDVDHRVIFDNAIDDTPMDNSPTKKGEYDDIVNI